jgi:hypothetical protein
MLPLMVITDPIEKIKILDLPFSNFPFNKVKMLQSIENALIRSTHKSPNRHVLPLQNLPSIQKRRRFLIQKIKPKSL